MEWFSLFWRVYIVLGLDDWFGSIRLDEVAQINLDWNAWLGLYWTELWIDWIELVWNEMEWLVLYALKDLH